MAGSTKNILEASGIEKSFGGVKALSGVELILAPNTITAVIGPNGSGKTTFLNCIGGVYRPEKGRIVFQGRSLVGLPPHRIARMGLGRTFQISRVFKKITVLENVLVPVLFDPRPMPELKEQALALLDRVGLLPLKDHLGGELSGGQQKLVEILRAWIADFSLILLDEPFAGVHPELKNRFHEEILMLKDQGKTFILVSHDMKSVYTLSDRIVVFDLGRIIAQGTEEEIKVNPDVLQAYLGS